MSNSLTTVSKRPYHLAALALQTPGVDGVMGIPIILWGPPGVGKSSRLRSVARALNRHLETVIASLREPSDFAGLPYREHGRTTLAAPNWAHKLMETSNGILFLDEASCATPATQSALLRVVLERVVGDIHLPRGTGVIAAANPPNSAAGGWDLAAPVANRFLHVHVGSPEGTEWGNYIMGTVTEESVGIVSEDAWKRAWLRVAPMAAAFISQRAGVLLDEPKDETVASGPWPSPRSWEQGIRAYATGVAADDEESAESLLGASVGTGTASTFSTWIRNQDLPDPKIVLANAEGWRPETSRIDRTLATLTMCAAEAVEGPVPSGKSDPKSRQVYVEQAWKLIRSTLNSKLPDLVMMPAQSLLKWRGGQSLSFSPTEKEVLDRVSELYSDAGVGARR